GHGRGERSDDARGRPRLARRLCAGFWVRCEGGVMSKQKCRMVVHANRENNGWHGPILYVDGAHLQVDVEECGWNTGELSHSLPRIPGAGLWILEGIEVVSECGYPDPPEVDVEYHGKWRRPTDNELARIARGGAPWESNSDELRPQVSLSRAAFDLQWDALVECSADELDVSALPHRRALCAIGSTADVAYERLCTLLRLFNGHFEVTGPDGGKVLDCDHCGTPCIPTCVACGETYSTTAEAAACEDAGFRSPRAPGAWRPITQPPSAEVHAWCKGKYLMADEKY